MTKTVDFTKKIVCSDESVKVVHVMPVNYNSSAFQYWLVYELVGGAQNHCAVSFNGVPMWGTDAYVTQLTFLNPKPKVVSTLYRNVYPSGAVSAVIAGRKNADDLATFNRVAVIEFLMYDDNSQKVNYIEV